LIDIKIAICDDEKVICDNILHLIKSLCTSCCIDIYNSSTALLTTDTHYDIYFLDVQMPDVNGIETAKQIRKNEIHSQNESVIIFITAFKKYMEEAFDVKAFHYLIKPIDELKLKNVFFKAVADCKRTKEIETKNIMVKSGNTYQKIFLRDILYIESRDKKVIITTTNGVIKYYGKMKEIENIVDNTFFRCHRCYIVSMKYITRYNSNSIGLNNGDEILLAQKKYSQFVKSYMEFARSGGLLNG